MMISLFTILPLREWQGTKLPFPIGVYDLLEISGAPFDLTAWRKIPQRIYMGELDTNDTVPYRDSWSEKEATLIKNLLGKKMMPNRWQRVQEILKSTDSKVEFATYRQIGHTITLDIENDLVKFFTANRPIVEMEKE